MRPFAVPALLVTFASSIATAVVGCGASDRNGFDQQQSENGDASTGPSLGGNLGGDGGTAPLDASAAEVDEVFGQSSTTLYRLDPKTKAVTKVGDFDGCELILDIALDESSTMYASAQGAFSTQAGLYTVDKQTGKCTLIKTGTYPNSLSFVPKGTLDANDEALVGYQGDVYVKIDRTTGAISTIGKLGKTGFQSSGDVVSVKGGSTYLTIKRTSGSATSGGSKCDTTDCLVEINPSTGGIVKEWGSIEHPSVFGLAFWGGKVYGFSKADLFEVTFGTNQVATSIIPISNAPANLDFWGAGSATSVPLVAPPQ